MAGRVREYIRTDLLLLARSVVADLRRFRFRVSHVAAAAWRHRVVGNDAAVVWVGWVNVANARRRRRPAAVQSTQWHRRGVSAQLIPKLY